MKLKIYLLMLLSFMTLCCGCSVAEEQNGGENPTGTGQVDSENAAIFKNSPSTVKKNRFENDYIRIWRQKKENGDKIWMQQNLDGTDQKQVPFQRNFLWLTNDWIYYYTDITNDGKTEYKICRVPVDNQNASYRTEEKDFLIEYVVGQSMFLETEFIVTDQYIIYGNHMNFSMGHTITYFRYDFQTKKNEKIFMVKLVNDLTDGSGWYSGIYNDLSGNLPVTLGNNFFVGGREGVFRVPFDTLKPVKIFSGAAVNHFYLVVKGETSHQTDNLMEAVDDAVYFTTTGSEILKYEEGSEMAEYFLQKEELQGLFEQLKLWDEKDQEDVFGVIEGFFLWNNKLYFNVTGQWSKKASEEDGFHGEREVLISADSNNLREWKLENNLSDFILKNAVCGYLYCWSKDHYLNYRWHHKGLSPKKLKLNNKKTVSRECYLYNMGDGKILVAYFSFSPKKIPDGVDGIEKEVLYDLDTGKILPLDQENYAPYYYWLWKADSFDRYWPYYYVGDY